MQSVSCARSEVRTPNLGMKTEMFLRLREEQLLFLQLAAAMAQRAGIEDGHGALASLQPAMRSRRKEVQRS